MAPQFFDPRVTVTIPSGLMERPLSLNGTSIKVRTFPFGAPNGLSKL
jgi:hypothetical protein